MKNETFAAWLLRTRKARGVSQTETAQAMHVTSPTVNRWERGALPRADQILGIQRWGKIKAEKLLQILAN